MDYNLVSLVRENYTKRLVCEALGLSNYHYQIPKDPEQRIFDFYFVTLVGSPKIIGDLIEVRTMSNQNLPTGHTRFGIFSPTAIEELKAVTGEIQEKLFNYLKKDLLDATYFSIASEFRHSKDRAPNPKIPTLVDFARKYGNEKEMVQYWKNYIWAEEINNPKLIAGDKLNDGDPIKDLAIRARLYKDRTQTKRVVYATDLETLEPMTKKEVDDAESFFQGGKSYINSYVAAKNAWRDNDPKFIQFSGICFNELLWNGSYGGPKWANIADGWMKLYEAETPQDKMVYIDHIFDLEHNTGCMLNKVKRYSKGGHGWIKQALDFKLKSKRPLIEFMDRISPQMSYFAKILRYALTGMSEEAVKNKAYQEMLKSTEVSTSVSTSPDLPQNKQILNDLGFLPPTKVVTFSNTSTAKTNDAGFKKGEWYYINNKSHGKKLYVLKIGTTGKIYGLCSPQPNQPSSKTIYKFTDNGTLMGVYNLDTGEVSSSTLLPKNSTLLVGATQVTPDTKKKEEIKKIEPSTGTSPTTTSTPMSGALSSVLSKYQSTTIKHTGPAGKGKVRSLVINLYGKSSGITGTGRGNFSGYFKIKKGDNFASFYYDETLLPNPVPIYVKAVNGKTKKILPTSHTNKTTVNGLAFTKEQHANCRFLFTKGLIANAIINSDILFHPKNGLEFKNCILDGCKIVQSSIPVIKMLPNDVTVKKVTILDDQYKFVKDVHSYNELQASKL